MSQFYAGTRMNTTYICGSVQSWQHEPKPHVDVFCAYQATGARAFKVLLLSERDVCEGQTMSH